MSETQATADTDAAAAPVEGSAGGSPASRDRQIHEPHKTGLPPVVPYLRSLWQRREFAYELSRTQLRSQHFNTVFGQLWLIINPLLLGLVYFILVDILRGGERGEEFLAHLIAGLFAFYFVNHSLTHGVKSVTSGGKLILNTAFPRILLPLSSVLTALKRFLPTLPVYGVLHVLTDRPIGPELLWIFPIIALLVVLASGLAMLVASLQVYFRDLRSFLPYGLRMWLYISPVLYFADEVPDKYRIILDINPIAPLLAAWSRVLIQGQAPTAEQLTVGAAWAAVLVVIGAGFFMSREREFAVRI